MSEVKKQSGTPHRKKRKKVSPFTRFVRRFCVPIIALLLIADIVLAVVLISKLAKEKEWKNDMENRISSVSSQLDEIDANAVYPD